MAFLLPSAIVFSIPFWILSAVITLIKIILSGTIGALLAFYIRHSHDSYASSIRWSRTGGVFEAVTLLRNSGRQLTTQSSIVATMTILASLFSLVASILLGALVSRADKSFDKGPLSVFTEQLISTDSLFWTAYMQADATAKETLMSTLNDTRRNPNPVPRTRYIPRTYDYEVACDDTAVIFGSTVENGLVYPPQVKCKTHMMIVNNETYAWDPATAFTDLIAPKTIMVATPVVNVEGSMAFNLPYIYFLGGYNSSICVRTPGLDLGLRFKIAPKDGLVSPPRTDATKCQLGSDKSIVLSATYIPFIVNHLNDFDKVTTSLFDDPLHLPLLQSMSVAISNGTFSESTGNQTMVMLINMSTTTDCLVCISTLLNPPSNDTGLLCTYMATAMITINPQEWDPIMAAYLNRTSTPPVKPSSTISTLDFAIYHLPKISGSKDTTATLSAAHLLQATTEAAGYLASLGHNVFVDTKGRTESEGLYIIYDTVELKDAFEVPTIPLVIVVVITVVCALVWGVSEVCFTAVYNGSLYKVIYQEIKMKEKDTSMLMTCTHDPLSFDGFQVFPDLAEEAGGAPTQGFPLLPRDSAPTDRPSTQLAPLLDKTHPASPTQCSKSPFVPTTTVATTDSIANRQAGIMHVPSQGSTAAPSPPLPPRPAGYRKDDQLQAHPVTATYTSQGSTPPLLSPPYQGSTPIDNPFW